ncbi:MAG TPA: iron-containing alcohol dehydrogenase [Sphingomonas sp.]|nr:iron-containing alcohol dehydrogenase [Sphingomonas sp.]
MIYNLSPLPSIFHVEHGAIRDVPAILDLHGIAANRVLIVTGQSHSAELAQVVSHGLEHAPETVTIDEHSEAEVARVGAVLDSSRATLLLAIGGGGVVDVAKRASKLFDVSCLVVPTVVSNDGLMSPISVLRRTEAHSDSLPAAMPIGVIADLDVLMAAPRRFLRAAGGDLLSNISATSDWRHVVARGGGPKMNDAAFHLARNSAESLVHSADCDLANPRFVRSLVVAQIYSGIAMTLAGTSRPCSGPEHIFSHAIDELGLTPDVLHGIQVGSICLFVLHLLGELSPAVIRFGEVMQIPLLWTELSPNVARRLPEIVRLTRTVRPDRRTLLDDWSDAALLDRIAEFGAAQRRGRYRAAAVDRAAQPRPAAARVRV